MSLTAHPYRLPLVRPWRDAGRVLTERRGVLLRLAGAGCEAGWGDCAPLPGDSLATWPAAIRCAVETARLDRAARRAGVPLAVLLAPGAGASVPVNAALGRLDDGCAGRAAAAAAAGFTVAKVKVGLSAAAGELDRLRRVADAAPLRLRLDANRAWSDGTAERFLQGLEGLPIEAVEEPLAVPAPARLAQLQAGTAFPLALDESVAELGMAAALATGVRRLVLKPAVLGGPLACLQAARRARAAGLEVVVTSVVDSAVGVTAAAHLAAALGDGPAHGLATLDWLAADVAPRPIISDGRLHLPVGSGLGLVPFGQPA